LLINAAPPGNEPEIDNAYEPVEPEEIVTPELMVHCTRLTPFHPAERAAERKSTLEVLEAILNEN
jgi:hypothetical protein